MSKRSFLIAGTLTALIALSLGIAAILNVAIMFLLFVGGGIPFLIISLLIVIKVIQEKITHRKLHPRTVFIGKLYLIFICIYFVSTQATSLVVKKLNTEVQSDGDQMVVEINEYKNQKGNYPKELKDLTELYPLPHKKTLGHFTYSSDKDSFILCFDDHSIGRCYDNKTNVWKQPDFPW